MNNEYEYESKLTDEDLWEYDEAEKYADEALWGNYYEGYYELYPDEEESHPAPMDEEFWAEVREAYDEIQKAE